MKIIIRIACIVGLLGCCTVASAQDKKLYCWNENGRKVCGDALPPGAENNARVEINAKSGTKVKSVDRGLTTEERAAAAVAAEQQAKLDAENAARQRRDMAMVESYASEDDLRRAFNERIVLSEESMKNSKLGIASLRSSLVTLLQQAADLELEKKSVSANLQGQIQTQHADLLKLQAQLVRLAGERETLNQDLEDALTRYRAFKAGSSAAPAPAAPAPAPNG